MHKNKWTKPRSQLSVSQHQDLISKNVKRKAMSEDKNKSPMVSVSTSSFKKNLSESSNEQNVGLGLNQSFPTQMPPLAHHSNILSTEKLELPISGISDLNKAGSEILLTNQSSSPQESENFGLTKPSSATPDSLCQTAQRDKILMSSECTPPGSASPQLDQLLSDLEEMKLKFRPETLDPPLSESSEESTEVNQIYMFEDIPPEDQCPIDDRDIIRVSVFSVVELTDDTNCTNAGVAQPEHFQTSIQDKPDLVSVAPSLTNPPERSISVDFDKSHDSPESPTEPLSSPDPPQGFRKAKKLSMYSSFPSDMSPSSTNGENAAEAFSSVSAKTQSDLPERNVSDLFEEDSTAHIVQRLEENKPASSPNDTGCFQEETPTQSLQDPPLWEEMSADEIQTEDLSSQSLSDLTPETVTSARHFRFQDGTSGLIPYPSAGGFEMSSDEVRPRTSEHYSAGSMSPVDDEIFPPQSASVKPEAEMTSSTSDEEYSIPPGYEETCHGTVYTRMLPGYTDIGHAGEDSPTFEYSDPEPYFDCRQATSDFSETEPEEPQSHVESNRHQLQDHLSCSRVQEKVNREVLLSSESEDYEDAPFVREPLYNIREESEEFVGYSEASDEEFTLCEASALPSVCEIGANDDTVNSLTREITAEFGSLSESSDDEFLTTRVVRRRVIIQADEMPDFPTQSVTEETYKDENGHIVVKRVTRKIVRKCISADGVEQEEVSLEGAPQESISTAVGDGYSKVVKRTVLKSEGDHAEVTFTQSEGFTASRQEAGEAWKVSETERTTVVEGERTMTHRGDPSLASDLPSAQDDFKQGSHA
ncbi:uncharacterized protein LOC115041744 isoform X2 [Echeneis naucrates]|uniref:uncharacterized protein LOC115041744 isoform X2 n=1 Tax=Echeneis naucrates TaxID=173247 RepID=UPI0011145365|nr:uncharacterized protein LOC115041744 isoform X2 [Echeneis naucrates]